MNKCDRLNFSEEKYSVLGICVYTAADKSTGFILKANTSWYETA